MSTQNTSGSTADFYVYLHRKVSNGEVFYVGKGKAGRAWNKVARSRYWKAIVAKHGFYVEIVQSGMQEWWSFELEKDLIQKYGRENLCNLTDGGDGMSGHFHSEESIAKMKGHSVSEETRKKISAGNKGKKRNQAERDRISEMNKGRKHSEEHKKRLSLARMGHSISEETRKKISAAQIGRKLTEAHKRKVVEFLTGRKLSDEHKANMVKGHAARKMAQQLNQVAQIQSNAANVGVLIGGMQ
jgi:hypothetical protein